LFSSGHLSGVLPALVQFQSSSEWEKWSIIINIRQSCPQITQTSLVQGELSPFSSVLQRFFFCQKQSLLYVHYPQRFVANQFPIFLQFLKLRHLVAIKKSQQGLLAVRLLIAIHYRENGTKVNFVNEREVDAGTNKNKPSK